MVQGVGRGALLVACLTAVISAGCSSDLPPDRPAWLDEPVASWPDLVLTNDLAFADSTYRGIGNAFFVALGSDTLVVTVKHLFTYLAEVEGLTAIDPGPAFRAWTLRSSRDPEWEPTEARLLTVDPDESIGDFQSLKDRDWLVLAADRSPRAGHVFELRTEPVEPGETVFAIGRTHADRVAPHPTVWTSRVFRRAGHHFYVQPGEPTPMSRARAALRSSTARGGSSESCRGPRADWAWSPPYPIYASGTQVGRQPRSGPRLRSRNPTPPNVCLR